MTIPVIWMQCDCYVWPIAPIFKTNRCGYCGVRPHTTVDAPSDGKARPL